MFASIANFASSFWQDPATAMGIPPTQLDGAGDRTATPAAPFTEPSVLDVLVVKAMLQKGLKLPLELIDSFLDLAEYWPHTTVVADYWKEEREPIRVHGGSSTGENKFIVRTPPLGFVGHKYPDAPSRAIQARSAVALPLQKEHSLEEFQTMIGSPEPMVKNPCRKIVFEITSRDQGWGGTIADHKTYKHSWTWFDVGLERFEAGSEETSLSISCLRPVIPNLVPANPDDPSAGHQLHHELIPSHNMIQCNVVAERNMRTHRVVWSSNDDVTNPDSTEAEDLVKQGRGKLSADGEFVRNLKLGDVVTVWAKARFPGWVNHVERVQVKLYWAV